LLNAYEFEGAHEIVIVFQTKFNDFTHMLHEGAERLGLGVTTAKRGNRGDVIAFFVLLDQYGEFSFWLHAGTLFRESYHEVAKPKLRRAG
jgi:hypothetical protein